MTEPNRQSRENEERIIEIEIERLRPFKEHPFQVKDDKEMFLLQESIEKYGILNPLKRINKTGVPMVELNFPKSSKYNIFVRGTSSDSTHKPWILNGTAADGTKTIHSYTQQIWIKGSFLVNELNKIEYI